MQVLVPMQMVALMQMMAKKKMEVVTKTTEYEEDAIDDTDAGGDDSTDCTASDTLAIATDCKCASESTTNECVATKYCYDGACEDAPKSGDGTDAGAGTDADGGADADNGEEEDGSGDEDDDEE